jgi:hypothetical protein
MRYSAETPYLCFCPANPIPSAPQPLTHNSALGESRNLKLFFHSQNKFIMNVLLNLRKAENEEGGYTEVPLVIPYAVNNHAENALLPEFYTPHELRLRNANGQGGYASVYDPRIL